MDEGLIYADVDASETYSYGPVSYKTTSLQRAKKKKEAAAAEAAAEAKAAAANKDATTADSKV